MPIGFLRSKALKFRKENPHEDQIRRVWYWLAVASGAVGLLYGMGLEGSFQTGGTVSDGAFITAMVLILLAVFFARLGFAAHDREQQERRKVHQQPRNTVKSGRKAG